MREISYYIGHEDPFTDTSIVPDRFYFLLDLEVSKHSNLFFGTEESWLLFSLFSFGFSKIDRFPPNLNQTTVWTPIFRVYLNTPQSFDPVLSNRFPGTNIEKIPSDCSSPRI